MKNIIRILSVSALALAFSGCADFDEINRNPFAVDELAVKPYYALNQSIVFSQQNPDTAERLFVINWAAAARQDGEDGYGTSVGNYSDGHLAAGYNHMCSAMTNCQNAINLCDVQIASADLSDHELEFFPNVKAFARIWMVYLMSEFTDSFGPMPTDGFQGTNPEFKSVKDVYYYMYEELRDAIASINVSVVPSGDEAQCDMAYGFDAAKWKAYGISMWMRLAMRLSEADPAKAQEEFKAALAAGNGILTEDETFRIQEYGGWDNLTAVMSRTWDIQTLSATMANLTTNFGVDVLDILRDDSKVLYSSPDVERYRESVKDADSYLGKRFDQHWAENTDNPTKQYFFDGLPSKMDPRALVYFFLPGDYKNRKATGYDSYFNSASARQVEGMLDANGELIAGTETDATYCWNGLTAGIWEDQLANFNALINGDGSYGYVGTYPALADEYRDCEKTTTYRVFFGPWETYFLLAEASLRGWYSGSAKDAYEKGVRLSLEYTGMGHHADAYLASEAYNRVGTSVKFDHTAEPVSKEMKYIDGYTGAEKTVTYSYPDASKILYSGKKLNDQLTKIITQKYIANTPWLPLENLSEHRRLGLPFWEIPVSTTTLPYMPEWRSDSWKGEQKPGYFVQRLPYPSALDNADPTGYAKALEYLGGDNSRVTPLWWAIGGH